MTVTKKRKIVRVDERPVDHALVDQQKLFKHYFEARFAPLSSTKVVVEPQSPQADDTQGLRLESEWEGFPDDVDQVAHAELVNFDSVQVQEAGQLTSKKEARKFMVGEQSKKFAFSSTYVCRAQRRPRAMRLRP